MTDEYSCIPVTPPREELWHLDWKRSTTQHKITLCADFSHGKKCLKLPRPNWKHLPSKWIAQHTREKSQEATEGFMSFVLWSWVCFIPIISFIFSHMPGRQSVHAFGWRKISFPNRFLQCYTLTVVSISLCVLSFQIDYKPLRSLTILVFFFPLIYF